MTAVAATSEQFTYVLDEAMTLLAVDDDPIQREFCTVYLTSPTVNVETADCAAEALKLLATRSYSAILLDVDMPGMSGIDLLKVLRSDPRYDKLPIMVVTGREDMASIDAAYSAGATTFMCKPVNWRLLAHQIRFMVQAHRMLDKNA